MKLLLFLVLSAAFTACSASSSLDHNKVVGCYFGAWAFYRKGEGQFDIEDFDARYIKDFVGLL